MDALEFHVEQKADTGFPPCPQYVSTRGECNPTAIGGAIASAVANAVVCTFVNVYAAHDIYTGADTALSCSSVLAVSGPGVSPCTCDINIC